PMNRAASPLAGNQQFGLNLVQLLSENEEAGVNFVAQAIEVALDALAEEPELGFADELGLDGRFAHKQFHRQDDQRYNGGRAQQPGFDGAGGRSRDLGKHGGDSVQWL